MYLPKQLIYPAFVRDGISRPVAISFLPGQYQHTLDSLRRLAVECAEAGIGGIDLFGVPREEDKDECGSQAWAEDGILNRGQRGWLDRQRVVLESVTGIVRAGADIVLTYWAPEIANWLC